jgi:hypothetical protein
MTTKATDKKLVDSDHAIVTGRKKIITQSREVAKRRSTLNQERADGANRHWTQVAVMKPME